MANSLYCSLAHFFMISQSKVPINGAWWTNRLSWLSSLACFICWPTKSLWKPFRWFNQFCYFCCFKRSRHQPRDRSSSCWTSWANRFDTRKVINISLSLNSHQLESNLFRFVAPIEASEANREAGKRLKTGPFGRTQRSRVAICGPCANMLSAPLPRVKERARARESKQEPVVNNNDPQVKLVECNDNLLLLLWSGVELSWAGLSWVKLSRRLCC